MTRILVAGAVALLLSACGSSGGDGSSTSLPDCSVKLTLTGDIDAGSNGSALVCADTNNGPGPTTAVVTLALPAGTLSMAIDQLSEGDTGDFPTTIFIGTDTPSSQWSTPQNACTVTITKDTKVDEHDNVRVYQLVGTGTCAVDGGPAEAQPVSGGAQGVVTISDFSFTARVGWTP